jgi:hypothetical protein
MPYSICRETISETRSTPMKAGILLALAAAVASGSALEDLAKQMAPGAWAELKTTGLTDDFIRWAPGHLLQWTDRGAWDSVSRRYFFFGGAHAPDPGNKKFISYSEADNSWKKLPDPEWLCVGTGSSCVMHGYEHITINAEARELYYRPFGIETIYRFDLVTDQWDGELPPIPDASCCGSLAYFPERKSLVYADGHGLQEYAFQTGKWSLLAGPKVVPMGPYHNMGIYNPMMRAFIFGGGNDSTNLYMLSSEGRVTTLQRAPFPMSIGKANLLVDPWSGKMHALGKREFEDPWNLYYVQTVGTQTWQKATTTQPFEAGKSSTAIAAAPIHALGVNFILKYDFDSPQVFLFKSEVEKPTSLAPIRTHAAESIPMQREWYWNVLGRRFQHSQLEPTIYPTSVRRK